jgi:hypothetical protein
MPLLLTVEAEVHQQVATEATVRAGQAALRLAGQPIQRVVRVDLGLAEIRHPVVQGPMVVQVVLLAVCKVVFLLVSLVRLPAVAVADLSLTKTLTTRRSLGLQAVAAAVGAIQPARLSHLLAQAPA